MSFNPCPKPIAPPKAPKRLNKVNRARVADNFKRAYHSRARQKFVNLQPCSACGVWGYSVNAHVLGIEGASLKGGYKTIAPLCNARPSEAGIYPGCHYLFDEEQDRFRATFPTYKPNRAARETERKWQAFLRGELAGGLPERTR